MGGSAVDDGVRVGVGVLVAVIDGVGVGVTQTPNLEADGSPKIISTLPSQIQLKVTISPGDTVSSNVSLE